MSQKGVTKAPKNVTYYLNGPKRCIEMSFNSQIFSGLKEKEPHQPGQHHVGRQIGTYALCQLAGAELEATPAGPPGLEEDAVLLDAVVQAENHLRNEAYD